MAILLSYWIRFDQTRTIFSYLYVLKLLNQNQANWSPSLQLYFHLRRVFSGYRFLVRVLCSNSVDGVLYCKSKYAQLQKILTR